MKKFLLILTFLAFSIQVVFDDTDYEQMMYNTLRGRRIRFLD